MKKRVLSIIVAITMLLVTIFATGSAVSANEATAVAEVDGTQYTTIDEAIANWTSGSKMKLLADVTLSDVITLKSTEHHVLNLGTYTMTAASGKHAIEITCNGRSSASYALTVNADAGNPGGITATGKSCIYYKKSGSTKDRPIILINNGVFNGSYSINSISNGNTNCPQIWINGGIFNGNVNLTKNMLRISGGTFNGWINCSGDSSAYRQITGGTFKSWQFMTADAPNKFWVGSGNGNYNVGCYVDDNGYLVVGGPVITGFTNDGREESFEASSANYGGWSNYLKYSSAATNELYYTSVEEALADNTKTTSEVTVYVEELDMTGSNYKGKILIPEGHSLKITYPEDTTHEWTVSTNVPGKTAAYDEENGEYVLKNVYTVKFDSMGGSAVADMTAVEGETITLPECTREGYTFAGWFKDAAFTEAWNVEEDIVTKGVNLYAKWVHTVTLNYGMLGEDQVIIDHEGVLDPHNPVFDGYVFMGWYADAAFETVFDITKPVTENMTLYAKFADYNVDLNAIETKLEEEINAANITFTEATKALEKDLNDAKAELQTAIDTKADTATVNAAIAKLQNAITALENAKDNYITADADLKLELEAAIEKAKQEAIDAAKGHIPYIGENSNWWIGDTDTGVDANGIKGDKGVTPQLRINSDNIWEVSYDNGATWESLSITAVGQNGNHGINGKDGKDGADGKDGIDGKDGFTPLLRINDENIWEVSYDEGKTWGSLDVVATGADGITPQLRINSSNIWEVSYDNGNTWTSMGVVATGADGKDATSALSIVISCISLAGMAIMFVVMMSDRKKRIYAGKH